VSYKTNLPRGGALHDEKGHYFLWGLVGEKSVNLTQLCPQGVARWKNQQTFVDGLLGFITLGIYIPRTITVECTGGTAYDLRVDGDRVTAVTPHNQAG